MWMSKVEERAQSEYDTSKALTAPLVEILLMQGKTLRTLMNAVNIVRR